jgi:hypothetical protein
LKTCGRSRTWQIVQTPSRACAIATPLRRCDTRSKMASTCGLIAATRVDRSACTRSTTAFISTRSAAMARRSCSMAFCSASSAASALLAAAVSSSASSMPSSTLSSSALIAVSAKAISC